MRLALRTVAVLIAIASIVDPAWSIDRPEPKRLVAIDLADGDAESSVRALAEALPGWQVERREGSSQAIPCATNERCVLVADGSVDAHLPADPGRPLSMISVRAESGSNVSIRSAVAASAHVAAAGAMRVELQRTGTIAETTILVRDGAAVIGSAVHKWGEGPTAVVDVPWWPLDGGARTLRIEATPAEGEAITIDNVLDVGVPVMTARVRALVFDARPSWNSTFVRRALEDDPRVSVEHRARVAPALTTGTRSGVLDAATLETTPVAIVGDPDALTAADVALLERFVRVRGGSLILLPERRITGPATRLLAGEWSEHLVPAPEQVGALQASELLRATNLPVGATVVARSASAASIVAMPLGNGRVIVSGAMDAWRYRDQGSVIGDQGNSFDRFWTSLVVEAATAGASLQIEIGSVLAAAGERVPFTIRTRSFEARPSAEMKATARCGDDSPTAIRVWPTGAIGEFAGQMSIGDTTCELEATTGDQIARAFVAASRQPMRGVDSTLAKLERSIVSGGGAVSAQGDEAAFASKLMTSFTPTSQIVSVRPMRAWWWMLPFAGCLAVEWWLRRRNGLR